MANDVVDKNNPSNAENSLSTTTDQQKVPPLRIVLNTAGNQKSSATTTTTTSNSSQQGGIKREKNHDVKSDNTVKSGGKVRIKLSTGKQQPGKSGGSAASSESSNSHQSNIKQLSLDSGQQRPTKVSTFGQKQSDLKEDSSGASYSHLRRITRRSQRAVQVVGNEDEESISSMTSLDENQNTNNIVNSDNNTNNNDADQTNSNLEIPGSTSATASSSNAANGSSNAETPRRYKRRKCETSESLSLDCDSLFGLQNYKLPVQNSFELFKNIRKQVDKRLTSLSSVHPKTPHGFRDYMLTRGAYLLDGNKLGNGTNLFLGEDGGLHSAPIGRFHALRHNKQVNYSVSSRAKVPLGLPVNSPLYDLFIEQEKERYKMRMQHIKEREKLTLSVEQEIMRVYNQAALAAVNQIEPFSACTMLKHQEIYNYLDSDGVAILSREDAQQEQVVKPDGVRTRRRQHGQVSPPPPPPPPGRKNSNQEDSQISTDSTNKEAKKSDSSETPKVEPRVSSGKNESVLPTDSSAISTEDNQSKVNDQKLESSDASTKQSDSELNETTEKPRVGQTEIAIKNAKAESKLKVGETDESESSKPKPDDKSQQISADGDAAASTITKEDKPNPDINTVDKMAVDTTTQNDNQQGAVNRTEQSSIVNNQANPEDTKDSKTRGEAMLIEQEQNNQEETSNSPKDAGHPFTEEDRQAYNKEVFLSQLQEIDDKWDRIRNELLIRHRNEAESLHAIQKLEWEWKTKEIGACDVRLTPIIDSTLVPKLNIYQQDY